MSSMVAAAAVGQNTPEINNTFYDLHVRTVSIMYVRTSSRYMFSKATEANKQRVRDRINRVDIEIDDSGSR